MLHHPLARWHWTQSFVAAIGVLLLLTVICEQAILKAIPSPKPAKNKKWVVAPFLSSTKLTTWNAGDKNDLILTRPDRAPEYPGGTINLARRLDSEFRYPAVALASGLKGFVSVEFIVERDGTISNVHIERGAKAPVSQVVAAQAIDAEALRLVRSLHEYWEPGQLDGQAIRSEFSLAITFDPRNYPVVR
ncbi:energy transducer TonB [Hymenobacter crusticola]|uniref:TonB C-terminal domain-containing protein n=1 Tax=Hymenobacter crusticola TaxID=1770526 RepID=A0A243W8W7_9BACT|nr:energy transducer TonB [Hymenobacter crusticola]OUJ71666.1 hypothetical protein BXP70_21550 [Hymenobacter crusticola]